MRLHGFFARKESEDIKAESCTIMESEPPRSDKGLKAYWESKNIKSIDGLPALLTAFNSTTTFDQSIVSRDWGKDDERISSEKKQRRPITMPADLKLIIGFLLGLMVSGLWVNVISSVAFKSKVL
jgi:hypothetical protein